jgi:hypothetical protein
MIDKLGIEVLAEEFSEETKRKSGVREKFGQTAVEQFSRETLLEQFGKVKDIEHRFCDPDTTEKQALGIEVDPQKESESDRDKRECVWLCRIADCKYRRVLFVCGNNHYDAFAQLLESNGFNVQRGAHYDISDEEFHNNADNVIGNA